MRLEVKTITKSLTKAHFRQNIKESVIRNFWKHLNILFDRYNENESEEHNKSILSDFLKDSFYKDKFEINITDKIDLAIYNGKSSKDQVSVIIEVKRPTKSNDMITLSKPNTKAFHELVLYFMKETTKKMNFAITHLIATDLRNWFIFDAKIFYQEFFNNNEFRRIFNDWKGDDGLFVINNDVYYRQIKDFLNSRQIVFECCYFDIFDFKGMDVNDPKLINLVKILSPEHLLRKIYINDSNSLNNEFYQELLYILGLEETSNRLIERKKPGQRSEGSLLENTITVLKHKNKYGLIRLNPNSSELSDDEIFSLALELCILWLNRILFLKLLEGQLVRYNNNDKDFAFLNFGRINDFDEVYELFFEVLSDKENERSESIRRKFLNIPYLNSSLFDLSNIERQTITIEMLKDRYQIPIISNTVLKDNHGNKLKGNLRTLDYLLRFLDSYNFASDSSDIVQKDNKQVINAAVLGLIFEKINGYKDGSHFTPGFVTSYMCSDIIRKAVVDKFNSVMKWNCRNFDELKEFIEFTDKDSRIKYNEIINSLKICDPAVGSGHFLVSALNELIAVKYELKILNYLDNSRIREYKLFIENDEIVIINNENDEIFGYRLNENRHPIEEYQKLQMALFHEKLNIIENCLFGVDINPKSVLICQLRLWIELLKNAYYKGPDYTELETLPNIDINIKCGNSLVSRFDFDNNSRKKIADSKIIPLYKEAVKRYKNVTQLMEKQKIKAELENYKYQLSGMMLSKSSKAFQLYDLKEKLKELTSQPEIFEHLSTIKEKNEFKAKVKSLTNEINKLEKEMADTEKNSIFQNSFEWRFDFPEVLDDNGNYIGFDIVLGNPPYGISLNSEAKNYFQSKYESAKTSSIISNDKEIKLRGSLDTFSLFIERGFQILNNNSYLSFIVPLAVTSSESMSALHNLLLNNCETITVSSYSNRPKKIFDHADQRVSIISFYKNFQKTTKLLTTKVNKRYAETPPEDVIDNLQFVNSFEFIRFGRFPKIGSEIELSILKKIFSIPLTLKDLITEEGKPVFYRTSGGRYYNIITNFSTNSTKENTFMTSNTNRDIIAAVLSSNLYYWFYHIYSNNLDLKTYELEILPVPIEKLVNKKDEIEQIYHDYIEDLKLNSKVKKVNYSNISEYTEYYARKSKHLIDKIDLAIQEAYNLNDDETNFLINYDIQFRTDED